DLFRDGPDHCPQGAVYAAEGFNEQVLDDGSVPPAPGLKQLGRRWATPHQFHEAFRVKPASLTAVIAVKPLADFEEHQENQDSQDQSKKKQNGTKKNVEGKTYGGDIHGLAFFSCRAPLASNSWGSKGFTM